MKSIHPRRRLAIIETFHYRVAPLTFSRKATLPMHWRIPSYLRFPSSVRARAPLAALLALLLATASALMALPALAATRTAPTKLTIQGLTNPADLAELDAPKLGWQVSQSAQSAYRVVVASSRKKAET